MKRFRSRRFAMLLILMLTLSMVFQGAATVAFAEPPVTDGERFEEALGDVDALTIEMKPDITVEKEVIGAWPDGGFEFTLEYWNGWGWVKSSVSPNPIYLTADNPSGEFKDRSRGEYYRVMETSVSGYDTKAPTFGGNEWFQLWSDQTAKFTNTQLGSVTVNKTLDPGYEGSKKVCFTLSIAPLDDSVGEVSAMHRDRFPQELCQTVEGDSATFTFENVPVGNYILTETRTPWQYAGLDAGTPVAVGGDTLNPVIDVNNVYNNPIEIDKSVVPAIAQAGDEVTYIFKVKNLSKQDLYQVVIEDTLLGLNIEKENYLPPYDSENPDTVWERTVTHVLTVDEMADGSFVNEAKVTANTCEGDKIPTASGDVEAECYQRCIIVSDSDDATVTLPAPVPETPTTTTITTVERDRAEPAGSFIPAEAVPLAAPVIIPAPIAAPVIEDEVIPLGVPVLPKTGELPMELFYGLGGMLTAIGAYLKRR